MNPIIGISCFCNLGKRNTDENPYYRIEKHYVEPIIKSAEAYLLLFLHLLTKVYQKKF